MDFQRSPSIATARPSMEQSPLAGNGSPDDSKKSRIAKACETCRKKKIKCDGITPSCTNCADHSRECVYRVAEQKRARPKGARYIETLEKRLERIEGLLAKKVNGALPVDPSAQTPVTSRRQRSETVNSHSHSPSNSNLEKPLPATPGEISAYSTANSSPNVRDPGSEEEPTEEEIEKLTERFFLLTNALGESKFIGSSSSFSIFSPDGIEWINEKTGDTGIQDIITSTSADSTRFHPSVPDLFGDLFQRSIFEPLPPKQQCLSLLEDFFRDFNSIMPLFHQPTFMHLVERQYSANPYGGSGWWASLNLALAISSRLTLRGTVQSDADRRARGYLKNAMGVLAELIVQNTDLLSVQAMVGMSLFMHCEANPEPSYNLVAAAIRVSYSIGLHKSGSAFNFNPAESEQRKRVFWIAYILDKEISLRMGRPPAQEDTDMSVELPNLEPEDNVGTVLQAGTKYNIFRLLAEFATIQSRLYKQLYSTEAAKQPIEKLLTTVGELDSELAEWKARIPKQADSAACTPVDMHMLMLQFGYYNCLATIHRMTGAWLSRLSEQTVQDLKTRITNPRVFSSAGICVAAARDSIRLLKYVPREDKVALWLIMYYPIASLITLFTGILQNPQASESQTDLELMSVAMDYVSVLCEKGDAPFTQARSVCAEFQRMAKLVVEKQAQQKSSTGHDSTALTNNPHPPVTPMNKIQPSASPQPVNRQIPGVLPPTMSYEMHGWADRTGATSLNHDMTGEASWANNLVPTDHMMPLENGLSAFDDMESLHNRLSIGSLSNAANLNSFQQSFIPQDLLNMPMDLDWDWVDTLGGYPGFENGQFGNGSMNN